MLIFIVFYDISYIDNIFGSCVTNKKNISNKSEMCGFDETTYLNIYIYILKISLVRVFEYS